MGQHGPHVPLHVHHSYGLAYYCVVLSFFTFHSPFLSCFLSASFSILTPSLLLSRLLNQEEVLIFCSPSLILSYSFTLSLSHSLAPSLSHSFTLLLSCSLALSLSCSLTLRLSCSRTCLLSDSFLLLSFLFVSFLALQISRVCVCVSLSLFFLYLSSELFPFLKFSSCFPQCVSYSGSSLTPSCLQTCHRHYLQNALPPLSHDHSSSKAKVHAGEG